METKIKTITVIIPVPSEFENLKALSFLEKIDYPEDKIEIILSIGRHPAIQRNSAVETAKGDVLYFLNKDSQVLPETFSNVIKIIYSSENIAGAGGPDLTPQDNTYTQHLFGYAMASFFAHGKMRARYSLIGKERYAGEAELILSNLAIKRDVFLKSGGFSEELYPNEENELINRICKKGYKFIYSPEIKIYRDRRDTLPAFMKQFYRYGCGRMSQIFIEGISADPYFLIPLVFLFYLISLILIHNIYYLAPFFIYVFGAVVSSTAAAVEKKDIKLVLLLVPIYLIIHVSYGIGMCHGFLLKLFKSKINTGRNEVIVKKIKV